MALPVDEERRRARDPADVGRLHVLGHPGLVDMASQVVPEAFDVEPELPRIPHQIDRAQLILVGEQHVMHLPEGALGGGRLGGFGSELRSGVDVGERKVPPHVPDAPVGQQLAHDRLGLAAVRALEVPELDHGDRGLLGAADVVVVRVDPTGAVISGRPTFELAGRWNGDHHDGVPIFFLTHRVEEGDIPPGSARFVTDVCKPSKRARPRELARLACSSR
jgi:hypothetical protein